MKPCMLFIAFLTVALGDVAMAEPLSNLTATLTPLRETYHSGEPVAVVLSLKNTSDKPIKVMFEYPSEIGISFTCKDANSAISGGVLFRDYRMSFTSLAPNEEIKRVIALNRYLTFVKPGKYTVTYLGGFRGPIVKVKDREDKYTAASYETKGTLDITIEAGPIDEKWIKELISVLEQKTQPATGDASQQKDKITKEEAVELLQWAETPLVIEPLIVAAKDEDMPDVSASVVKSLQKFFKEQERARSGILEIANDCGMAAFQAAMAVYEKEGVAIPGDWFKTVLAYRNPAGKPYMSLEYLGKHGTADDARLVEPLMKSKNKAVADLATRVFEELKARPAVTTPPVPVTQPDGK